MGRTNQFAGLKVVSAPLITQLIVNLAISYSLVHQCDSQQVSQHLSKQQQPPAKQTSFNSSQPGNRFVLHNKTNSIRSQLDSFEWRADLPTDWLLMGGGSGEDLQPEEAKNVVTFAESSSHSTTSKSSSSKRSSNSKRKGSTGSRSSSLNSNKTVFDDDSQTDSSDSNEVFDDIDEAVGSAAMAGSAKGPECASNSRYYCTYKEEYPIKLVTEVTKYYKWPLEKLFRDLHAQIMPKLAQDSTGNLVCDSITRVVRPGWTRNTNDRWLVVINTENYHQYVTEVVCQYGSNSRCNFIPPCYYSSCQQRYNTQKLLVIDPTNPYRGPFLSEFLFPSCCVCYVPTATDSVQDKYRASPATIYQRTLQQESAVNLYPPKFRPASLSEDPAQSSGSQEQSTGSMQAASSMLESSRQKLDTLVAPLPAPTNQPLGPGEIRRLGEIRYSSKRHEDDHERSGKALAADFPRLGMTEPQAAHSVHRKGLISGQKLSLPEEKHLN